MTLPNEDEIMDSIQSGKITLIRDWYQVFLADLYHLYLLRHVSQHSLKQLT
jgi:hypothetical protein